MIFSKKKLFCIEVEARLLQNVLDLLDENDIVAAMPCETGAYHLRSYTVVYRSKRKIIKNNIGEVCYV